MRMRAFPSRGLRGHAAAPGDKSISHRAFILGALAEGASEISGVLEGADVMRTRDAAAAFGAGIERLGAGRYRIQGCGARGFEPPADVIDFGNAGTGVRLMMGAACGFPIAATYTGDESLRARPMDRVIEPLSLMGARALARQGRFLPATLLGPETPRAISYAPKIASAQVKSAVLLCALRADGITELSEAHPTRSHTETLLNAFGASVETEIAGAGRIIRVAGGARLTGRSLAVPGDPSSAAFPIAAALIAADSEVTIENVLAAPERFGFYQTLIEMGADIEILNPRIAGGEKVVDLRARTSALRAVAPPAERVPAMVDEIPILALLAAFADGRTVISGAEELRVKESDRLALMAGGLKAIGVRLEETRDGLVIHGAPGAKGLTAARGSIATHGDHRIAMTFLVAGLALDSAIMVERADMIATSFPNFAELMQGLGARIEIVDEAGAPVAPGAGAGS